MESGIIKSKQVWEDLEVQLSSWEPQTFWDTLNKCKKKKLQQQTYLEM